MPDACVARDLLFREWVSLASTNLSEAR